ncbi:5'-methylthioadenosine phosphorylase [Mariniphaga anaerophila]|uniref:Purine nucleoside phosphorylase n=1 Tax=Mariniphaga anaerophila TaxID=1484053 RepID=A0A1M5BP52_9BACT|nr:S-methyl-5'-thioadenosine phosphorylase [Mariniphaga anaerophila]SHF44344.1 5'-methylthioadenosine phosphorylase [Mariniphaga anaerophila]
MKIAIIGGSGLEDPDILKNPGETEVETPYGNPSSSFKTGRIEGVEVAILSRHGRDHGIPPSQVNSRANIWAIKELGCSHILATTACGSLRGEIERGDLVIPDQFIDFTRHREITFFERFEAGNLQHCPMSDPFDKNLRQKLIDTAGELNLAFHHKGTVITIEGPRFSTRAESNMFRMWGADIINMSVAPECILANEMQIPYAAVALSTDYDCWKTDEAPVTWEEVLRVFNQNVKNVIRLLKHTIAGF